MQLFLGTLSDAISGIVTDITTLFGSVQTFVIGVVVFVIAIAIVKMLKKK